MVGAADRIVAPSSSLLLLTLMMAYGQTTGVARQLYDNSNDFAPLVKRKNLCAIHPELFVCKAYEDADLLIGSRSAVTSWQRDARPSTIAMPADFPRPDNLPMRLRMNVSRTGDLRPQPADDETLFGDAELRARRLELMHELERIEATEAQLRNVSQPRRDIENHTPDGRDLDRSPFEPEQPPLIEADRPQPPDLIPDRVPYDTADRGRQPSMGQPPNFPEYLEQPMRPIRPVDSVPVGPTRSIIEGQDIYSNTPTKTAITNEELRPYYPPAVPSPSYYGGSGASPAGYAPVDGYSSGGGYYGSGGYGTAADNYQSSRHAYGSPYGAVSPYGGGAVSPYGNPYSGGYGAPASRYGYGTTRNVIGELFGFGTGINLAIPMLGVDVNTGIGIAAG